MVDMTIDEHARPDLILDPEFQHYLQPLSESERQELKASIMDEGVREPLKVWVDRSVIPAQTYLIDGFNRHSIATEIEGSYSTNEVLLGSRDEVKLWMIKNQLGRRNISPPQRQLLIGERFNLEKKSVGRPASVADDAPTEAAETQSIGGEARIDVPAAVQAGEQLAGSTAERIAKEENVNPRTVREYGKVAEEFKKADGDIKEKFLAGNIPAKKLTGRGTVKLNKQPAKKVAAASTVEGKDANTELMCRAATASRNVLKRTKESIQQGFDQMAAEQKVPAPLATKLSEIIGQLEDYNSDLSDLCSMYVCLACDARPNGCKECEGGYVNQEARKFQLSQVEESKKWAGKNAEKETPPVDAPAEEVAPAHAEQAAERDETDDQLAKDAIVDEFNQVTEGDGELGDEGEVEEVDFDDPTDHVDGYLPEDTFTTPAEEVDAPA